MTDPSDGDCGDVAAVRCRGVAGPHQGGHDAADALDGDAAVDGVLGRRRGPRHPGGGVVVAHGLQDGGHGGHEHAEEAGNADGGPAELDCDVTQGTGVQGINMG